MSSTDMNSSTPTYVYVVSLLVAVAIVGAYFYPKSTNTTVVQQTQGTSPVGSTFGTAKFAGAAVNLSSTGQNGTSTSLTNTDSNARYVTGTVVSCENVGSVAKGADGSGLANLTYSVGTTSAASPNTFNSFARIASQNVSTSSQTYQLASSTSQTATSSNAFIWGAGVALSFSWNATNTADCTEGVNYVGS